MYTDEQIRQADAALKLLHGKSGFTYGHELWQVMSHAGKDANAMRSKMVKELGLISREGDNYQITEEGEKAYEMGFMTWQKERIRKAKNKVQDDLPWYIPDKRSMLQSIIASVAGAVVGALVSWLLMR